jgi:hypothetical protein
VFFSREPEIYIHRSLKFRAEFTAGKPLNRARKKVKKFELPLWLSICLVRICPEQSNTIKKNNQASFFDFGNFRCGGVNRLTTDLCCFQEILIVNLIGFTN